MVPVYSVFAASDAAGVNVAVVPAYATAPDTGAAPGPVNVNVVVLIVAGAITVLNVAVTVVFSSTPVAPFAGDVATTTGDTGLKACSRPHPAAKATNTNASNTIFPILNLRISFSCSTGDKAFPF
jgi:hypothetical protein